MKIVKDYRDNKELRDSYNALAEKTFCLNFENWYQNGFWTDKNRQYSIEMDGKIVANVSVNDMHFMWNGEKKHFIQLGTVMTDKEYRGHGFMYELMNEIDKDYEGKCDGIYLFANQSVLEFYPKFGFQKEEQYQYSKEVTITTDRTAIQVPMKTKKDWDMIVKQLEKSQAYYGFDMVDNSELVMFYLSQFMTENVYYIDHLQAYVVAEEENGELLLHAIYAEQKVNIDDVIKAFGKTIKKVKLGFVPDDTSSFTCNLIVDDDTTLFVKGESLKDFSKKKLMFQPISHA